jgi:release factor glutamine methyltransferase
MPKTPATIKSWLVEATKKLLEAEIITAVLDCELILTNILEVERTYLHAHPEKIISPKQLRAINRMFKKRLKNIPMSYILKYKEFYGRKFFTDKAVLIPRPESEDIIDVVKSICKQPDFKNNEVTLVDIGTGSGCLGITAKLEVPRLEVTLSDVSIDALRVARFNAVKLRADLDITSGNLLENINERPDIIIANLPYVDKSWDRSSETDHEPTKALFAKDNGMALIKKLIRQAEKLQRAGSYLILEADPRQHDALTDYAHKHQYMLAKQTGYILSLIKY